MRTAACVALVLVALSCVSTLLAQPVIPGEVVDKWVTATGRSAGAGETARDDAVRQALRKAVEETCGVFLTSQSRSKDYQAVYDRVFSNTVGYVVEHEVTKVTTGAGITTAQVRVRVSTRKFEENWADIAHTLDQENNPRLIVAIVEHVQQRDGWNEAENTQISENGIVQGKIEDFMISHGVTLMDRTVAADISKRDVLLAAVKDEPTEVASLAARFNAEVVVTGRATVKYGNAMEVAGQTMHQYVATLTVRVIQTDSARVLAVKSFPSKTYSSMNRVGGEDKALSQLGQEYAPKLMAEVVEAWRKRANISRTVSLSIAGMNYETWKPFKDELEAVRGVRKVSLREITDMAHVDVECEFSNEGLADRLGELTRSKLSVVEITANRLKLKLAE